MSVLWITVPATLALAVVLLALVLHQVFGGGFDDLETPGLQILDDDDSVPERETRSIQERETRSIPERETR